MSVKNGIQDLMIENSKLKQSISVFRNQVQRQANEWKESHIIPSYIAADGQKIQELQKKIAEQVIFFSEISKHIFRKNKLLNCQNIKQGGKN